MIENFNLSSHFQEQANQIAAQLSKFKDNLLIEVLKENNVDIYNLTNLVNKGKFLKFEKGEWGFNYQIFNYDGRDLLIIYDPEYENKNGKWEVNVKYGKLY